MKAICIIASDNVVIDGDVIFNKPESSGLDYTIYTEYEVKFTEKCSIFTTEFRHELPLKVKLLWFWHMVVLQKSHVYLTGALR